MSRDAYDFWADRVPAEDIAAIRIFWSAFERDQDRIWDNIHGRAPFDVPAFMDRWFAPFEDRLFWEFGDGAEVGKPEMVWFALTAESVHKNRPLARAIVARAPASTRWHFQDVRPSTEDDQSALLAIEARLGGPHDVEEFDAAVGAHGRVNISVTMAGDTGRYKNPMTLVSVLLGEKVLRDRIGAIDVVQATGGVMRLLRRRPEPLAIIRDARAKLESALVGLDRARGDAPFMPDYKAAPRKTYEFTNDDKAPWRLIAYSTTRPDYAEAVIANQRISTATFSKHGESIMTLLLRAETVSEEQAVAVRDELDAALRPEGGVFGEGRGPSHFAISFASAAVDFAIVAVKRITSGLGLDGDALVLFENEGLEALRLWPATDITLH